VDENQLQQLLQLVNAEEGLSIARAAKKMNLSQSQLARLLTVLCHSPVLGGLDCIERRGDDPPRLYLTANGRTTLSKQNS
jgi:hypothetical protein